MGPGHWQEQHAGVAGDVVAGHLLQLLDYFAAGFNIQQHAFTANVRCLSISWQSWRGRASVLIGCPNLGKYRLVERPQRFRPQR